MNVGETLEVRLSTGQVTVTVVKVNAKTCWVRLPGPGGKVVKRKAGRDYAVR